jgi:predicted outer membrane protein
MKSSSSVLAVMLTALCASASAQVGDGPVPAMTSPPSTIYSSSPPSAAVRPMSPNLPKTAPPRVMGFGAGAGPATSLSSDSREERRFLRDAAAQSRFELDASKMAFAKSGNSSVRTLAASLINHHNVVGLELTHLLNARGMALPMMTNEQRKTLNQLTKATGGKFDSLYMHHVGIAQATVARDYEKASATIREPQINSWIVKTIATTRYHQNMAERSMQGDGGKWNRGAVRPTAVSTRADGRPQRVE